MILFISGRTDIVAFYSKWFINRLKIGYIDVRNPFNPHLVSRIFLSEVDLYVFCTKNPRPIIDFLPNIKKPIIFQITLTPYKEDIEPNVKNKKEIIESIKKISNVIGKENVYVRYDPIFINQNYTIEYHIKAFEKLCDKLNSFVKHIIISFLDDYKNVRKNKNILKNQTLTKEDYKRLGESFYEIAKKNNITVQTCFEKENLSEYGFKKDVCVGKELAYKLTGRNYKKWNARNCGCVEMVDIGVYNSCKHFCKYCYANYDEKKVLQNYKLHDENSSLLVGNLEKDDVIKIRK